MVARYEPATWRGALDPDRSLTAAAFEAALYAALAAVPRLVLTALDRDAFEIVEQDILDSTREPDPAPGSPA
jgi:hypothetical protein